MKINKNLKNPSNDSWIIIYNKFCSINNIEDLILNINYFENFFADWPISIERELPENIKKLILNNEICLNPTSIFNSISLDYHLEKDIKKISYFFKEINYIKIGAASILEMDIFENKISNLIKLEIVGCYTNNHFVSKILDYVGEQTLSICLSQVFSETKICFKDIFLKLNKKRLQNLTCLNLSSNQIENDALNILEFEKFDSLNELDLSYNSLSKIEIKNNIIIMNLSGNCLSNDTISDINFSSAKFVNLSSNLLVFDEHKLKLFGNILKINLSLNSFNMSLPNVICNIHAKDLDLFSTSYVIDSEINYFYREHMNSLVLRDVDFNENIFPYLNMFKIDKIDFLDLSNSNLTTNHLIELIKSESFGFIKMLDISGNGFDDVNINFVFVKVDFLSIKRNKFFDKNKVLL